MYLHKLTTTFGKWNSKWECLVCLGVDDNGSLPSLCPRRPMTQTEKEMVRAGRLDFTRGTMTSFAEPQWWAPMDGDPTTAIQMADRYASAYASEKHEESSGSREQLWKHLTKGKVNG